MTYHVVTNPGEETGKGPIGYKLRHGSGAWGMLLVPLPDKPFSNPDMCPSCQTIHMFKTVHLNLEPGGTVIVSSGVLKDLQKAGLSLYDLVYEGPIHNPPPLNIKRGASRKQIDFDNRAMKNLGSLQGVIKNG